MKKILLLIALLASVVSVRAEVSAAKRALARQAITAMQADKIFDTMGAQLKQMVLKQNSLPASATPAQRELLTTFTSKVMDLSMAEAREMMSQMDVIYAEVYSEAELQAMVAFFKAPEGQSMLAKQPQIMAHLMPLIQQTQQNLMPKVAKLTQEFTADMEATKSAAAK